MKMARADNGEVVSLLRWLQAQEQAGVKVPPWERTVFGYQTLVENTCDPTSSVLEWKPGIIVNGAELKAAVSNVLANNGGPIDKETKAYAACRLRQAGGTNKHLPEVWQRRGCTRPPQGQLRSTRVQFPALRELRTPMGTLMRHKAPQKEIRFADEPFALVGQVARAPQPVAVKSDPPQDDLFICIPVSMSNPLAQAAKAVGLQLVEPPIHKSKVINV